ncbi:hypothetical protein FZC66_00560 [Priestia megaterium]|nr:hypothetical protein FZC66_00560 [Priestia megaterium]
MGVYIEGYTSKKVIRRWLDNYESMAVGDKIPDDMPRNTGGPKVADGWGPGKLNKLMLDQALEKIPDKVTKYCVYARWVHVFAVKSTLKALRITKEEYYNRCSQGVDFIYSEINGERAGVKNLLELILQGE